MQKRNSATSVSACIHFYPEKCIVGCDFSKELADNYEDNNANGIFEPLICLSEFPCYNFLADLHNWCSINVDEQRLQF